MPQVDSETRAAMYLFCQHLEQNGLYDWDVDNQEYVADEGYHFDDWNSPSCREIPKVYVRSGAQTLLGSGYDKQNQLVSQLRKAGCIAVTAGEVGLTTGHWRRRQAEMYGYDDIYREGYYSVPHTYVPSINLVTETYQSYRSGGTTRQAVIDRVITSSPPERPVDEADAVFDAVADDGIPQTTLFRVLHAEQRFNSGVAQLRTYVASRAASGRLSKAAAEEALDATWDEIQRRGSTR